MESQAWRLQAAGSILVLVSVYVQAQKPEQNITVRGIEKAAGSQRRSPKRTNDRSRNLVSIGPKF
jgi:hypothetical protein